MPAKERQKGGHDKGGEDHQATAIISGGTNLVEVI